MVKILLYLLIVSITFSDWLVFKLNIGDRVITWLPEIFSIILALYVVMKALDFRRFKINLKYLVILVFYISHISIGIILNQVPFGVTFAGLRIYLKFLPLFLLPAAFEFRDRELKHFLKFMFVISLIQCPVAIYQRFISYAGILSGDPIGGTFGTNTSGVLSVFLICSAACYVAYFLRGRINFHWFTIGLFILLFPTTLNETKITFVLIPAIFILPFIFSANDRFKIKKMLPLLVTILVVFLGWKVGYDHLQKGPGITAFVTKPGSLEGYSKARWGPMILSHEFVSKNIMHFVFGVGAGNASDSYRKDMVGEYAKEHKKIHFKASETGLSNMIFEIGHGGVLIFCVFFGMLLFDTIKFSSLSNYFGTFALSMISLVAIFWGSFLYVNTIGSNLMVYPFFFLAGFISSGKYYSHEWK